MQNLDSPSRIRTIPTDPQDLIPLLLPEEIEQITEQMNNSLDEPRYYAGRTDLVQPVAAYFKDGRWLVDRLGDEPIDMTYPASFHAKRIAVPRLIAEKLARQRKMILLCRANMTDDEFVEWATETLPILVEAAK